MHDKPGTVMLVTDRTHTGTKEYTSSTWDKPDKKKSKMAKASFLINDAAASNFGIKEGNVEIVGAITKVHQYPPNRQTGVASDPFPCVQLEMRQFDKDWSPLGDDTTKMEFSVGKIEKFHPGNAVSAEDQDPEDVGVEVDVEGNCIVLAEDGARFSKQCAWIRFTDTLEQRGFKPEVLGNGFVPELIGTRMHVTTIELPRMPNSTKKEAPTALVCTKIEVFPYDKKTKVAVKPVAGKPVVKSTAATPAAAKTAPVKATDTNEDIALSTFIAIATENPGEQVALKVIKSKAVAKLMRNKVPVTQHKSISTLITDHAWLEAICDAQGYSFDASEEIVMFPAAE